jgi:hypothetical protein
MEIIPLSLFKSSPAAMPFSPGSHQYGLTPAVSEFE